MSLGTLQQTVSVQAQAALVESCQSTQGGSVRPTEVAELPILNRTMAAVMILIAGSREVSATVSSHGAHCRTVSRYEAAARTFKRSSTAPKTGLVPGDEQIRSFDSKHLALAVQLPIYESVGAGSRKGNQPNSTGGV